jgi:pimeloyl-ACP methyl ester carboxylesterase
MRLFAQAAIFSQFVASYAVAGVNCNQSQVTRSLTTHDGQTYTYDFSPSCDTSKPTVLLLHGYPSSRHHWKAQFTALAGEGFGVLAPDLLGYGDSSKPTSLEAYNLKDISGHLTEILDAEGLDDVVGVGHDWGATVLSRAVAWYPERFNKIVFVAVAYLAPGLLFDIDAVNAASLKTNGYLPLAYWYFFNTFDAAGLMSQNVS